MGTTILLYIGDLKGLSDYHRDPLPTKRHNPGVGSPCLWVGFGVQMREFSRFVNLGLSLCRLTCELTSPLFLFGDPLESLIQSWLNQKQEPQRRL